MFLKRLQIFITLRPIPTIRAEFPRTVADKRQLSEENIHTRDGTANTSFRVDTYGVRYACLSVIYWTVINVLWLCVEKPSYNRMSLTYFKINSFTKFQFSKLCFMSPVLGLPHMLSDSETDYAKLRFARLGTRCIDG